MPISDSYANYILDVYTHYVLEKWGNFMKMLLFVCIGCFVKWIATTVVILSLRNSRQVLRSMNFNSTNRFVC